MCAATTAPVIQRNSRLTRVISCAPIVIVIPVAVVANSVKRAQDWGHHRGRDARRPQALVRLAQRHVNKPHSAARLRAFVNRFHVASNTLRSQEVICRPVRLINLADKWQ